MASAHQAGNPVYDREPGQSAFEISVRSAGAPIALQEFRLISEADALAGSYTVDLNAADKYDFSAADETFVSVNLKDGDSYKVAETDKDLTFTVFTLPRDLNKLSVRFTTADGITRTLKLKKNDQFINFTGGRKHRIYGLYLPKESQVRPLHLRDARQRAHRDRFSAGV